MTSESEIIKAAHQRLDSSSHLFRRTVRCDCSHGVLKISGRLPSFYLKQTAQSLLDKIDGVKRVENEIVVVSATIVSSKE